MFFCCAAFAQDSTKKITVINDLQTLKSKGFLKMKADTLSSKNFRYKSSVIRLDTADVIYKVKSSLKLKFDNDHITGEIKEVSTNMADASAQRVVKVTAVSIRMIACCTPYKDHPQHCCDPSEVKEFSDTKNCKGWTFVAAPNN